VGVKWPEHDAVLVTPNSEDKKTGAVPSQEEGHSANIDIFAMKY
jgi:hypothetical protein